MDWKLQLFKLNYDTAEKDAVLSVLDSGWLTMGTKTIEFEDNFKSLLNNGGTQCLAVSSCTAALHMSLLALGIGSGDEVIIPGLTFIADANSVMMTGAKPVLADSHSFDDWNLSKESIENVITEKTKAVIVVHFAGFPCNMNEIQNLCKEKNIFIIEDVAHAPGPRSMVVFVVHLVMSAVFRFSVTKIYQLVKAGWLFLQILKFSRA